MLEEEQIQCYARQVLLREVGGRGQARLLAAQVAIDAAVPGAEIATAYLVASGVKVHVEGPVADAFVTDGRWESLSPDQLAERPGGLVVRVKTVAAQVSAPVIEVTASQLRFRTAAACLDCWSMQPPSPNDLRAPDVAWGSLVALIAHRLVLDLAEPLGHVTWDGEGFVTSTPRCPAHQTYRVLQAPRP